MSDNYNDITSHKNALSKENLIEQREKVKQPDSKGSVEPKDKNGKTLHLKEVHVICNSADFSLSPLFPYDSGKKTK